MDREREVLVTERYGPSLPRDLREQMRSDPAFRRMSATQQEALISRPFVHMLHIPMYSVRSELAAYYYDLRNFVAYDWIITSGAVRNRYLREPRRFPRQIAFYELLDELADPAWSIRPRGTARGPALDVYRLDDGFRTSVHERLGPRRVDHYLAFTDALHAPHFINFAKGIGRHAEFAHRWSEAAFWFEVLAEAARTRETVALGYERAGLACIELRELGRAQEMFIALRSYPEREVVALGNLGLIAELQGDPQRARDFYDQVIVKDPNGQAAEWARARRAKLSAPETGNGP